MNELEEAAAIQRCKAGDKEAFRTLVEKYEKMLFGIAWLMTRDRDLAADAVQETFLKMWKHISSLREGNGLKAWLARILVNEVKQQGRKKRVPTVPIEQASGVPDGSEGIEIEMERGELREAVRKALRLLPNDQAQAVVLRYFGGLTLTEIAFAMGCREGTVKSRRSRALGRLEGILREEVMAAWEEVEK